MKTDLLYYTKATRQLKKLVARVEVPVHSIAES